MNLSEIAIGFAIAFALTSLILWTKLYFKKDNRVAYIDVSGSMTWKMMEEAIYEATALGIKRAAYFSENVSAIMDLTKVHEILGNKYIYRGYGDGPTMVNWLVDVPVNVDPHIFTDGEIMEESFIRRNATLHVIKIK